MYKWVCGLVFTDEDIDTMNDKIKSFKRTHEKGDFGKYDRFTISLSAEEHLIGMKADKFVDVEEPFRDIDTGVITTVGGLQTYNIPYFYIVPLLQRPRYLCGAYQSEKEMIKEFKRELDELVDFLPDNFDYLDHLVCLDLSD